MLTKQDVLTAIYPHRYVKRDGTEIRGERVTAVPAALREYGWRGVASLDFLDFRSLGLEVVEAQYVGGARPTGKWVLVVVKA